MKIFMNVIVSSKNLIYQNWFEHNQSMITFSQKPRKILQFTYVSCSIGRYKETSNQVFDEI